MDVFISGCHPRAARTFGNIDTVYSGARELDVTRRQLAGMRLLADAISRARTAAQTVGSAGIFVDAKNNDAEQFYLRYDFHPCGGQALKLFLSMW